MTNPADWSQQVAFYAGRLAEMTRERDNEQKRAEQAEAERDEARAWVKDLHSGMYINCVYCGHRYGPKEDTPSSMADVLKAHVEQCPQHPMSALKAQLATAEAERDRARDQLAGCCACQHDGRGALTSECQEHQEQREAFAALRTALAQLVTEAKKTESFLESVEWIDTTVERDVADIQQALLTAISDADDLDWLLKEK